MIIRLNRYLASCGLGARRKVEDLITSGRISINGDIQTSLSTKIDTDTDTVEYDGTAIVSGRRLHYVLLNKPKGYVTTMSDEMGRMTVMDIIPEKYRRDGIFPVGRLDKDTEGLLLLTNDGDLANRLSHPKFKVEKEYVVEINSPLKPEDKSKMKRGIFLHQIMIKTAPAFIKEINRDKTQILIRIAEGKKRQIRYTFEKFGYRVEKLKRTGYGPLTIEGINRGGHRSLKKKEISDLLILAGLNT